MKQKNRINEFMADFKHAEITKQIIKSFYAVYNALGYGFLEKVYMNALVMELNKMGISAVLQKPISVFYDGKVVGEYFADIMVHECVIVEVKAAKCLTREHEAQLLNYLKATEIETGLLINFGPQPEIKRKAFDNFRKH